MYGTYGILSDSSIKECVKHGLIRISPFSEKQVNPSSYDLTLGEGVGVYDSWVDASGEPERKGTDGSRLFVRNSIYDPRQEPILISFQMSPEKGWVLKPGIGYLMHTKETVWTNSFVPVLDGKSSVGRLFISIHETAGYGDVGFDGQYTLEVTCTHPVRVFPGMRIAQIRFHTISGEVHHSYEETGKYKGESAQGAVASQLYRNFR